MLLNLFNFIYYSNKCFKFFLYINIFIHYFIYSLFNYWQIILLYLMDTSNDANIKQWDKLAEYFYKSIKYS